MPSGTNPQRTALWGARRVHASPVAVVGLATYRAGDLREYGSREVSRGGNGGVEPRVTPETGQQGRPARK